MCRSIPSRLETPLQICYGVASENLCFKECSGNRSSRSTARRASSFCAEALVPRTPATRMHDWKAEKRRALHLLRHSDGVLHSRGGTSYFSKLAQTQLRWGSRSSGALDSAPQGWCRLGSGVLHREVRTCTSPRQPRPFMKFRPQGFCLWMSGQGQDKEQHTFLIDQFLPLRSWMSGCVVHRACDQFICCSCSGPRHPKDLDSS